MARLVPLLLLLLVGCQTAVNVPKGHPDGALDRWDEALGKIVTEDGKPSRAALEANRQALIDFLTWLDETPWPKSHWARVVQGLNAFNAGVLYTMLERDFPATLLDTGPRKAPGGAFYFWRTFGMGNDHLSLWELEQERLRVKPQELRVHAALWRGHASDPPLRNELYRRTDAKVQLDDQMTRWLQDPTHGAAIVQGRAVLPFSFKVHAYDFDFYSGGLNPCGVVAPYMPPEQQADWVALTKAGCPRAFRDYDMTVSIAP